MRNLKYLMLEVFVILFYACQSDDKKNINAEIEWKIPIEEAASTEVKLSDLLDDAFFLPLETKENNLLGEIKNVKFHENKIYLSTNRVLACYDMQGNHVFVLDRMGRGPGEYQKINDFVIDDSIYLLDDNLRKVHVYDKGSLKFHHSIDLPFFALEMEKIGDNLIFSPYIGTNSPEFNYELLMLSLTDGKIIKHLPYPMEEYEGVTNSLIKTKDTILYASKIRNSIYLVNGDNIEKYAGLVTKKNINKGISDEVIPYAQWRNGDVYRGLSNWGETTNFIGFRYRFDHVKNAYYNKNTGEVFNNENIKNDLPPLVTGFTEYITVYNDYFVAVLTGENAKDKYEIVKPEIGIEDRKNNAIDKLYNTLEPAEKTGNPTLLFYKFK